MREKCNPTFSEKKKWNNRQELGVRETRPKGMKTFSISWHAFFLTRHASVNHNWEVVHGVSDLHLRVKCLTHFFSWPRRKPRKLLTPQISKRRRQFALVSRKDGLRFCGACQEPWHKCKLGYRLKLRTNPASKYVKIFRAMSLRTC